MMDSARSESGPFPQKIFLRNQSARTPVVPRLSLAKLKGDGTTLAASKLAVDERLGAASSVTTVSAPPVSCGATFVELEPFLDDDNEDSPEAEADVRHCSKSVPLACISSEGDVSPLVLPLTSKLASVPSSSCESFPLVLLFARWFQSPQCATQQVPVSAVCVSLHFVLLFLSLYTHSSSLHLRKQTQIRLPVQTPISARTRTW
eukprot:Gregarina_sp_Poly_1__5965@NODE_313_length_9615_cov_112_161500_g268_i0_p6_GENE_NODE_313_length_9615_cov_112_161500_g268_i0NODE_313_length_9615_cov_112_161500_g268_i0_p6_ORF_typecomplete_len204_score23_68_NODE_313_length_9615_cov_112_161500_g268_i082358846